MPTVHNWSGCTAAVGGRRTVVFSGADTVQQRFHALRQRQVRRVRIRTDPCGVRVAAAGNIAGQIRPQEAVKADARGHRGQDARYALRTRREQGRCLCYKVRGSLALRCIRHLH